MLVNKKHGLGVLGIICAGIVTLGIAQGIASIYVTPQERVAHCEGITSEQQQIDCLYDVIRKQMQDEGIGAAMETFTAAYERFRSFAGSGCHLHAHRVGDMAYYGTYLQDGYALQDMKFPQDTTACGYGFFHGFIEHLIQDNPDPAFVTETCEYLRNELGDTMGDMGITCYHGSGHGFTLHQSERISRDTWGNIRAFTDEPIEACESLSKANADEIEECRQGVFNVIVQWMEDEDYGFSYNTEDPFAPCNILNEDLHHACYYEMAQKLNSVAQNDPHRMVDAVRTIDDKNLQKTSFGVGIAGVVQQTIADDSWMTDIVPACLSLDNPFKQWCIGSVVHGLFEHGPPQEEYKQPLALCQQEEVTGGDTADICYSNLGRRLDRFYEPEKAGEICARLPEQYQKYCEIGDV